LSWVFLREATFESAARRLLRSDFLSPIIIVAIGAQNGYIPSLMPLLSSATVLHGKLVL
jgi:hypothetical protein